MIFDLSEHQQRKAKMFDMFEGYEALGEAG